MNYKLILIKICLKTICFKSDLMVKTIYKCIELNIYKLYKFQFQYNFKYYLLMC